MQRMSSTLKNSFGWLLNPDLLDPSWRFWFQALALSGLIFSNSSYDIAGDFQSSYLWEK